MEVTATSSEELHAQTCCVRERRCFLHILTGLHAVAAGSLAMLSAQHISAPDEAEQLIELYNYHREASLDDFYKMSQMADTPFGSVSQYKHKFRHLFHSTSQVVYFHYPSYMRRKQVALSLRYHETCLSEPSLLEQASGGSESI